MDTNNEQEDLNDFVNPVEPIYWVCCLCHKEYDVENTSHLCSDCALGWPKFGTPPETRKKPIPWYRK